MDKQYGSTKVFVTSGDFRYKGRHGDVFINLNNLMLKLYKDKQKNSDNSIIGTYIDLLISQLEELNQ